MATKQETIEQLIKTAKELQDTVTATEFITAFKKVMEFVKKIENKNIQEIEQLKTLTTNLGNKLKQDSDLTLSDVKAEVSQQIGKALKEQEVGMNFIKDKVRNLRDGKDADETKIVQDVLSQIKLPEQKEIILDTPEQLRDKLETLEKEERLDMEAVRGLKEALDKAAATNKVSGLFGTRRVYQPYRDNFTSQTDGATKTFYLSREPLKTDTIMVFGTDFPIILDPATDFTVSGKALTLTDAIDAPTTGASLVVIYFA